MLKIKLDKEGYAALAETLRAEYKQAGDDYILDTDTPVEDVSGLKSALQNERLVATQRQEKIVELTKEVSVLKSNDVKAIEDSWRAKEAAAIKAGDAKANKYLESLKKRLVTDEAEKLASAITKHTALVIPHVLPRLRLEETNDGFITRVLDREGKPSALTINELQKEIVDDKQFAPIILTSAASGGGANGNKSKKTDGGAKKFSELNEAERTHLFKTNRAEYDRLKAEK